MRWFTRLTATRDPVRRPLARPLSAERADDARDEDDEQDQPHVAQPDQVQHGGAHREQHPEPLAACRRGRGGARTTGPPSRCRVRRPQHRAASRAPWSGRSGQRYVASRRARTPGWAQDYGSGSEPSRRSPSGATTRRRRACQEGGVVVGGGGALPRGREPSSRATCARAAGHEPPTARRTARSRRGRATPLRQGAGVGAGVWMLR